MRVIGLAIGEGLAEIEVLRKLLADGDQKIHYIAVDSSRRLLRDHIGLLKETFSSEIKNGRLLCGSILCEIFSGLHEGIESVRRGFAKKGVNDFFSPRESLLVTYFGNCLGSNYYDHEADFFSHIHSLFPNRPLEILVGVSVLRTMPDKYERHWDDFLLQTPRHLLETKKLLHSTRPSHSSELPEFTLPQGSLAETGILSGFALLLAISQMQYFSSEFFFSRMILFLVAISAFFYEILLRVLLDRIGNEEKNIRPVGMVMRTYGLMAISAAFSLWVLGLIGNSFSGEITTLFFGLASTVFFVRKRKFNN